MYLNKVVIENMGGIQEFRLDSDLLFKNDGNPKPVILIGKNGAGKTTVLANIVDALFELENQEFQDILPKDGMGYKYFKLQGGNNIRIGSQYSFSYVKFKKEDNFCEYIDKTGEMREELFREKIGEKSFVTKKEIEQKDGFKRSHSLNHDELRKDIENNSYCYFPSDRHETPYWANIQFEDRQKDLKDNIIKFTGNLGKKLLVRKSLDEVRKWILDVYLDTLTGVKFGNEKAESVKDIGLIKYFQKSVENIESMISKIVQREIKIDLNLRNQGLSRIKIIDKKQEKFIFHLLKIYRQVKVHYWLCFQQ